MSDARGAALNWVRKAAAVIREGGVILYPTETVYGLGCDPGAVDAIRRIERLKGRMPGKPMLVLTDAWSRVGDWVAEDVDEVTSRLEGEPVTFLFPASDSAPRTVVGPTREVGIRCTSDTFCRELIRAANCPIVSTSANHSGDPAPATLQDLDEDVIEGVDLVISGSGERSGVVSTILRVSGGEYQLVREGAVSHKRLQAILGEAFVRL